MLKAAPHAAWFIAGPSGVALAAGLFGHLFLFDFVVYNMARGQLVPDFLDGNGDTLGILLQKGLFFFQLYVVYGANRFKHIERLATVLSFIF